MTLQQLFTSFDGRINRQTFWIAFGMFFVVNLVLYLVLGRVISIALYYLVGLVLLYPGAAVAVKRLKDMNQNPLLALLFLIPLVNLGMLAWVGATPSTPGDNAYGAPQGAQLEFKWA